MGQRLSYRVSWHAACGTFHAKLLAPATRCILAPTPHTLIIIGWLCIEVIYPRTQVSVVIISHLAIWVVAHNKNITRKRLIVKRKVIYSAHRSPMVKAGLDCMASSTLRLPSASRAASRASASLTSRYMVAYVWASFSTGQSHIQRGRMQLSASYLK